MSGAGTHSYLRPAGLYHQFFPVLIQQGGFGYHSQESVVRNHRHAEKLAVIHFLQNFGQFIMQGYRYNMSVHQLAGEYGMVHGWIEQVRPDVIQVNHPHESAIFLILNREVVAVRGFNDIDKLCQAHVRVDADAVGLEQLLNTQICQYTGIGAGTEQLALFHQIFQIKGGRLQVVA